MFPRLTFAALGLICALPAQAQDWYTREVCDVAEPRVVAEAFAPSTPDKVAAAAQAYENGVGRYWRITSPGGAVSHLWGTMHSTHRLIIDLPDRVVTEIEQARAVALEIDFVFQSRAEYTDFMVNDDRYVDSISDSALQLIPNKPGHLRSWVAARLVGTGWDAYAPEYLTPAALAEMLLASPCDDLTAGTYPSQDSQIQTIGYIAGAEIIGLESPDAFTDKLNNPANRQIAAAIIAAYAAYLRPDLTADDTSTTLALYLQGRVAESMVLDRIFMMDVFGPEEGQRIIDLVDGYLVAERNLDFVKRIRPELDKGGVFMAVGNFHLPLNSGLVALLRNAGYTVERIPLPGEAPG